MSAERPAPVTRVAGLNAALGAWLVIALVGLGAALGPAAAATEDPSTGQPAATPVEGALAGSGELPADLLIALARQA